MNVSPRNAVASLMLFASAVVFGLAALDARAAGPLDHYEPGFLRHAERALAIGKPERALAVLQKYADTELKSPYRAESFGLACRANLLLGNSLDAKHQCESALNAHAGGGDWRYFNNLGVAELQLGNLDAARAAFSAAVDLAHRERTPRRNLASVRSRLAGAQERSVAYGAAHD